MCHTYTLLKILQNLDELLSLLTVMHKIISEDISIYLYCSLISNKFFMVVIIGAGPIGLAVAIELKKRGIQSRIIERGALVDSIFNYPVNMTFFSTSDKLEIGNIPFISHGPKPTRSEALEYYRRAAEHFELDIRLYEEVQSVEGDD